MEISHDQVSTGDSSTTEPFTTEPLRLSHDQVPYNRASHKRVFSRSSVSTTKFSYLEKHVSTTRVLMRIFFHVAGHGNKTKSKAVKEEMRRERIQRRKVGD